MLALDGRFANLRTVGPQHETFEDTLARRRRPARDVLPMDAQRGAARKEKKMRKTIKNGFTLIELMVVVAIIGILAAIAIPAFMKNVRKSKTTEATTNIKKIAEGATSYYHEEMNAAGTAIPVARQFPGVAGAAGATGDTEPAIAGGHPCCTIAGVGKCQPNPVIWTDQAWQQLKFAMTDPHYYAYMYNHDQGSGATGGVDTITKAAPTLGDGTIPTGTGAGEYFYADAIGDLNCDGTFSTFETFGGIDGGGNVSLSAGHAEASPLE
jgi:type IV pilus assembly protein PilA